jgi:hypothetical protein
MTKRETVMNEIPNKAKLFLIAILLTGTVVAIYAMLGVQPWHHYQFVTLLVMASIASRLKAKLPGLSGNMSVNLPFILIAQAQLNPAEALLIACASTFVQCLPRPGTRLKPVQVLFNIATMAIAVEAGCLVFHNGMHLRIISSAAAVLACAAAVFFVSNTLPVAGVISLTEGVRVMDTWSQIFHLSFPYYVASAGITSMVTIASQHLGWHVPLMVLAVAYGMYRSYQRYFNRLELMPRLQAEVCTVQRAHN